MPLSLRTLAVAVDTLESQGRATITETPAAVTIAGVKADAAQSLAPLLSALAWPFQCVDSAGELADAAQLSADYEPFIVTLEKPVAGAVLQIITIAGFRSFLREGRPEAVWQLATLDQPFTTMASDMRPWNSVELFSAALPTKSPRELVRENNVPPHAPSDIRTWILRANASVEQWSDAAFQAFAELASHALMRALAGEIKNDGGLIFVGPPRTQLDAPASGAAADLGLKGFNDLREAAAWVYENGPEAEQRHSLFVSEFGATHPSIATASLAFARVVENVLQGARFAYRLSLSDLTREAIKAQGDLRKAVTDDTAKLADNTRQVATAVAASLATSVGLIAAKVGTSAPHWVLQTVAVIACLYVVAVIASGYVFMTLQRDMRSKWRSRLYRFVADADYKEMVTNPAARAERMFAIVGISGGIIAFLAFILVCLL